MRNSPYVKCFFVNNAWHGIINVAFIAKVQSYTVLPKQLVTDRDLLGPYLTFTCRVVSMGPSGCCNSANSRRRQQFTLTGTKVETIARYFLSAFSSTLQPAANTSSIYDSAFIPGSLLNLELGVSYMCRDEKMC